MHIKKHLSFSAMRKALSELFEQIVDTRQAGKVDYPLHDCLMSALAMMFYQDPSILSFQRRMQDRLQESNLKNMFGVTDIPTDSALRQTLDEMFPPRRFIRRLTCCSSGCSEASNWPPTNWKAGIF